MIQNLIFNAFFFENIFSGIQSFYIRPQVPVDIISVFFLTSDILAESLKVSKNYRKRSLILQYSFAQKTSLILRTSTHIENNMVLQYSQNLSEFTKISQQTCFCLVSEKTFALHRFLTPKTAFLKHFESKCPFISVYLRKKRRSKILSDGK